MKLSRALAIFSPDPLTRISALERATEYFLRKLPKETVFAHLEVPEAIPQERMNGARLFSLRHTMLCMIPEGGVIAEVGTWRGGFSKLICETVKPDLFHLIDLDFSEFDWSGVTCPIEKHQGDSSTILRGLGEAVLDWAYIDGDHSYDGARKDIEAAHRALKPGGLMTCNDYTNWSSLSVAPYGVARAVNEFVIREGYTVEALALSPWGAHDILIRKP